MTPEIRRREGLVALSDRGKRYRYAWLPAEPKRVLVLVHGYAEHAGRYDAMAVHFAARGFAVHAYDQAGHGRTPGPRGHVDRFDRLLDELARFVELASAEHPGLPVVLAGHSMGGLVVAATTLFRAPAVERVVLSGPLLTLDEGASLDRRLRLALARVLARIAPTLGLSSGLDANGLSRDGEVVRRYREDPYVEDHMTVRFAVGLSDTVARVRAAAERFDRPVLIAHGEADPICPVAGSRFLHARLSPAIAGRSRLSIYPRLRHEIWNEPERESIWQEMLAWLDA